MGLIVFYTGYQPDCNNENVYTKEGCGGSEIAFIEMTNEFVNAGHEVKVFSPTYRYVNPETFKGVTYMNDSHFEHFCETHDVDALIITRYIYVLMSHRLIHIKKVFLWMHDLTFIPYFDGFTLPHYGTKIIYNMLPRIEKIVFVSEYQKRNFEIVSGYTLEKDQYAIIGNGVSKDLIDRVVNIEKVPFSFIWCSNQARGLSNLARMWPLLIEKFEKEFHHKPYLTICGNAYDHMDIQILITMNPDTVNYIGKVSQFDMFEEMKKAQIWFYPTNFNETYCMVAKEAQLAQCICIAADVAALKDTLGSGGIVYPREDKDEQIIDLIVQVLKTQSLDPISISSKVIQEDIWQKRADEWLKLIF